LSAGQPSDALSFVVAAYNVGPHIGATLDSLLAGSLPTDEIIVVDDGSTDDTAARVRAHPAAQARQLTLLQQPNEGVASARLKGLAAASRPFVWFFDGDDLLQPQHLGALRAVLLADAPDVVLLDFDFYWPGPPPRSVPSPARTHTPRVVLHKPATWLAQAYDDAISSLWSRVARRSLYAAVLPERCPLWSRYEDLAASPHVLAAARSLYYLPLPLVQYRQRSGSLSAVWSLDGCENLVRSALFAAEARAAVAAPEAVAVADAAWRMVARKLIEAVRRASEAGASADELLQRLVLPVLAAMGRDVNRVVHQLRASRRAGDRRVAAHLHHFWRWPHAYAAWRVALRRVQRRRS
jgi:GT2 family glycosyltransferase